MYRKMLEDFNSSECIFSRNLIGHLEGPEQNYGPFFSNHLPKCHHCQEKVREYVQTKKEIISKIPKVNPPDNFYDIVRPELKEVINLLDEKFIELKQSHSNINILRSKGQFKLFLNDLIFGPLKSKTFYKGALISVVSYFFLKIIVH